MNYKRSGRRCSLFESRLYYAEKIRLMSALKNKKKLYSSVKFFKIYFMIQSFHIILFCFPAYRKWIWSGGTENAVYLVWWWRALSVWTLKVPRWAPVLHLDQSLEHRDGFEMWIWCVYIKQFIISFQIFPLYSEKLLW